MENKLYRYSVVIPVYNEEESLAFCHSELTRVMSSADEPYELIFVNDGSRDNSLTILKNLAAKDNHVKVISFSRNFGQQAALLAGFTKASGDAIINIDADLQDPPEAILQMIAKFKEGYDVVLGKRKSRSGESFFKKFTSNVYQTMLKKMSKINLPTDTGDFRLISRRVNDVLVSMPEHGRYVRGMTAFVGFKQTVVEFDRAERKYGKTKYNLKKLVNLGLDGIVANSDYPLHFNFALSFAFAGLSGFLTVLFLILLAFGVHVSMAGWLVPILSLFTSIIVFSVGIVGLYVGKTFLEVQNRPQYIIDEQLGFDGE